MLGLPLVSYTFMRPRSTWSTVPSILDNNAMMTERRQRGLKWNVVGRRPHIATVLALKSYSYSGRSPVLVLLLESRDMKDIIFDHDRLDVSRLSIDYVASSFETARPA